MGDIMRPIVEFVGAMAATLSEHERVSQCRTPRCNMDRSSTSKIKTSHRCRPAVRIPCPACDWIINNCRPDEHEHYTGKDTSSFSGGTDCKSYTERRRGISLVCIASNGDPFALGAYVIAENMPWYTANRRSGRAGATSDGAPRTFRRPMC